MIEVSLVGNNELDLKFGKLLTALDKEHLLDQAQAILLNRIRTRFLSQQASDYTTWPESQAAVKRRKSGRDGGTLFDTGTLFRSLQAFATSDPNQRAVGTDVPYGVFHQFGTVRLPIRDFLSFGEQDTTVITQFLQSIAEGAIA